MSAVRQTAPRQWNCWSSRQARPRVLAHRHARPAGQGTAGPPAAPRVRTYNIG